MAVRPAVQRREASHQIEIVGKKLRGLMSWIEDGEMGGEEV